MITEKHDPTISAFGGKLGPTQVTRNPKVAVVWMAGNYGRYRLYRPLLDLGGLCRFVQGQSGKWGGLCNLDRCDGNWQVDRLRGAGRSKKVLDSIHRADGQSGRWRYFPLPRP